MIQKQTVYLPVSDFNSSERAICTIGIPDLYGDKVIEKQGYFFTPEQLNKYIQGVIKQSLETAAEKCLLKTQYIDEVYDSNFEDTALPNEKIFLKTDGDGMPYAANKVTINKDSIINTFEETFNKFKV